MGGSYRRWVGRWKQGQGHHSPASWVDLCVPLPALLLCGILLQLPLSWVQDNTYRFGPFSLLRKAMAPRVPAPGTTHALLVSLSPVHLCQ